MLTIFSEMVVNNMSMIHLLTLWTQVFGEIQLWQRKFKSFHHEPSLVFLPNQWFYGLGEILVMKIKFESNYKCFTFLFDLVACTRDKHLKQSRPADLEFWSTKDHVLIIRRIDELSSVAELEIDDFLGVFWILELVCLQRDSAGTDWDNLL